MITVLSCSAFKLYIPASADAANTTFALFLNIQFRCLTAYLVLNLDEFNIDNKSLAELSQSAIAFGWAEPIVYSIN
jgi:hypothetical protein